MTGVCITCGWVHPPTTSCIAKTRPSVRFMTLSEAIQAAILGGQQLDAQIRAAEPDELAQTVLGQLDALVVTHVPEDWVSGRVECPPPPPELTDTYTVAFGSAVRHCDHARSSVSTRYDRGERQCDDCGQFFRRRGFFDA